MTIFREVKAETLLDLNKRGWWVYSVPFTKHLFFVRHWNGRKRNKWLRCWIPLYDIVRCSKPSITVKSVPIESELRP